MSSKVHYLVRPKVHHQKHLLVHHQVHCLINHFVRIFTLMSAPLIANPSATSSTSFFASLGRSSSAFLGASSNVRSCAPLSASLSEPLTEMLNTSSHASASLQVQPSSPMRCVPLRSRFAELFCAFLCIVKCTNLWNLKWNSSAVLIALSSSPFFCIFM